MSTFNGKVLLRQGLAGAAASLQSTVRLTRRERRARQRAAAKVARKRHAYGA